MLFNVASVLGLLSSAWTFLLCGAIMAVYLYCTWHFKRWERMGISFIPPTPFFGNVKDRILLRRSFAEVHEEIYRYFDDEPVGGMFEGRRPILILRDPDIIKNITVRDFECFVDRMTMSMNPKSINESMLIFMKGSEWKTVRRVSTPIFTSGKMKAMSQLVTECTQQMISYLDKYHTGKEIEMKEFFGRFTLDVIASCAFGIQCDSLANPDAELVQVISRFNDIGLLNQLAIFLSIVVLNSVKLAKLFNISFMNKDTVEYLSNLVLSSKAQRESEVAEARETGTSSRRVDFLQLMLDAQAGKTDRSDNKEVAEQYEKDAELKGVKTSVHLAITDNVLIGQSLLFLLAGFETSSTLLTFASYELALNPEVQERARMEIREVLERHDGRCSYEAIAEMPYLENVLNETLRKHPPVARVERTCTAENYHVEGTKARLHKGDIVAIPIRGLHYDPRYYPKPEIFDPDRFLPENKQRRSPYVFLPFGCGPRNCIGMRFAMMSTKMALASLLNIYNFEISNRTEIPVKINIKSVFLKAANGVYLYLKKIE